MRRMMPKLTDWLVAASDTIRYLRYRAGRADAPWFQDHGAEWMRILGLFWGWDRNLRIIGAQHYHREGPAVFVGNHIKLSDPFFAYAAIHRVTRGPGRFWVMMRDDFFGNARGIVKWFDMDRWTACGGALQISRDRVQFSQLKPFLNVLAEGQPFLMYNGRSRSRSGQFFEYRDCIAEPGGVGLFLAHGQRRAGPDRRIPAVPLVRTWNPVTNRGAIVFGSPMYIAHGANHEEQRAFDYALAARMGDLVEINVPHVVSVVAYLQCLHRRRPVVARAWLDRAVRRVFNGLVNRYVDPRAITNLEGELDASLRFLAKAGALSLRESDVVLHAQRILYLPPPDAKFLDENPVRYLANQVLHLRDITSIAERVVLS